VSKPFPRPAWKLSFSKLTGPATAAHIHLGGMGKAGNVVVPLCGPCQSGMTGTATISAALMKDFTKHLLYVNVHTAKNRPARSAASSAASRSVQAERRPGGGRRSAVR